MDLGEVLRTARRARGAAVDGLVERRRRHASLDLAWRVADIDREADGGILAAALATRVFLFVVPLGLVLVTGVGLLADAGELSSAELSRRAGITGLIASAVGSARDLSIGDRILLLLAGSFATASGAARTVRVLDRIHAVVWDVPTPPRRGWRTIGATSVAAALVVGALVLLDRLRGGHPVPGAVLTVGGVVVLPLLGWLWLSDRLPHDDAPRWARLPGAALMAVGVQTLHLVTVYWLSRQVEGRSDTYGTLAVALAVLLWATFVSRLVVLAVELNAATWARHRERRVRRGPPGTTTATRPG